MIGYIIYENDNGIEVYEMDEGENAEAFVKRKVEELEDDPQYINVYILSINEPIGLFYKPEVMRIWLEEWEKEEKNVSN